MNKIDKKNIVKKPPPGPGLYVPEKPSAEAKAKTMQELRDATPKNERSTKDGWLSWD